MFIFVGVALCKGASMPDIPEGIKSIIVNAMYLVAGVNISSVVVESLRSYKKSD